MVPEHLQLLSVRVAARPSPRESRDFGRMQRDARRLRSLRACLTQCCADLKLPFVGLGSPRRFRAHADRLGCQNCIIRTRHAERTQICKVAAAPL